MYDNPCKHCGNLGHCMAMMSMPMYGYYMPMVEEEEEDDDLKKLYPKLYIRTYPMVKHHCDMMESRFGTMYCPTKEEMDRICEEICDRYEEQYKDDDDDDDRNEDEEMRQRRRRGRRRAIRDLVRILFIRDLLGRRRRRRPHYGYGYGY